MTITFLDSELFVDADGGYFINALGPNTFQVTGYIAGEGATFIDVFGTIDF